MIYLSIKTSSPPSITLKIINEKTKSTNISKKSTCPITQTLPIQMMMVSKISSISLLNHNKIQIPQYSVFRRPRLSLKRNSQKENFKESIVSVLKYFEFINLEVDHIEEDDQHWLLFSKIDTTIGTLRLAISLQPYQVIAYAFHPLIVIEPIRTVAMEFVTRANFGLPYGKFELIWIVVIYVSQLEPNSRFFRKTEFVHIFHTTNWRTSR